MSVESINLTGPDDFHVHLRQEPGLGAYARTVEASCARALVMPNTIPPITAVDDLVGYAASIRAAAPRLEVLPTFKLTEALEASTIGMLKDSGAVAGKYYPAGVTTNAADGVRSPDRVQDHLAAMEEAGLVLCVHAEEPGAPVLDREKAFLPRIEWIVERYPRLKLVIEHVSKAETVKFVETMPARVGATVTAHHLAYSIEDLLGDGIRPHLYCKPLLKRIEDRDALREAVFGGNPRFFFGSDSAPHPVEMKECACGAAGVYTAPVAVPLLISLFEAEGAVDRLDDFTGTFGAAFYQLPRSKRVTKCVKRPWRVPAVVDGVVSAAAGTTLEWRVEQLHFDAEEDANHVPDTE